MICFQATLSDTDKFRSLFRMVRRRCRDDSDASPDAACPLWPPPHEPAHIC